MRLTADQGTAADQPHIIADLQIRPARLRVCQNRRRKRRPHRRGSEPEPSLEHRRHPEQSDSVRPQPLASSASKSRPASASSIAPLACTIAGCASLLPPVPPGHRRAAGGSANQCKERAASGNESRGPGKPQRPLCQRNRTAAINPPEQAGREQYWLDGRSHCRDEGAGLHGPSNDAIFVHHRRMAP